MDLVRHVLVSCFAMVTLSSHAVESTAGRVEYCGTERWHSFVAHAATRFDLPEDWLHAVMRTESGGCETMNGAPTISSAGAMGLMQLMPSTWATYREQLQLGDDPHYPSDNILAGSAYLRDLYDRYGWPGAVAAYHAGPTRYDEHLSGFRPLPRATTDYVARVERLTSKQGSISIVDRALFAARAQTKASADAPSKNANPDEVFIPLRHSVRHNTAPTKGATDVQQ